VASAIPFVLIGIAAMFGLRGGVRARGFQVAAAVAPLSVAAHPLVQPLYLESRDTRANLELQHRFSASNLMGKSAPDVTAVLGEPTAVRSETPRVYNLDGRVAWQGEPYTIWEYKPLPYYWSGRKLQLTFKHDVVAGFAANAN
jgi:hypothetical protein